MYRNLCFKQHYDNFLTCEDPEVQRVLLSNYDKDHDGKLSMKEILSLKEGSNTSSLFYQNTKIKTFKEFAKFTNIIYVGNDIFRGAINLEEVWFPPNIISHWYRPFLNVSDHLKRVVITGNPMWLQNITFNKDTFWRIPSELKVYIPDQYLPKYKEDTKGWLWNDRIRPLSQYPN